MSARHHCVLLPIADYAHRPLPHYPSPSKSTSIHWPFYSLDTPNWKLLFLTVRRLDGSLVVIWSVANLFANLSLDLPFFQRRKSTKKTKQIKRSPWHLNQCILITVFSNTFFSPQKKDEFGNCTNWRWMAFQLQKKNALGTIKCTLPLVCLCH